MWRGFWLVCLMGVLATSRISTPPTAAQIVLSAPLLAATPATHDHIVLYDLAGGRRELSFGAGVHHVWDFSPDGCRVLFTLGERQAAPRLYSARLDGSDMRELVQYADLPSDGWGVWEPDWSPDGARIAFTMIRDTVYLNDIAVEAEGDTLEYRIAWIDANGGAPAFYSLSGDEHTPVWSPDGAWLAYIAYEERLPGADIYSTAVPTPQGAPPSTTPLLREADLWIVRSDAAEKFRLTYFDTGSVTNPKWNPGGDLLGFVYSPTGSNDQFWMVGAQPGALPTQLSEQWALALDLAWLPNGAALLAAVRDFREVTENRIWQIPLTGDADNTAFQFVSDPALSFHDFPRFSPDGRWLALRSEYALALVDMTDGTWRLLDETPGNSAPVWSPPGFVGELNCPR